MCGARSALQQSHLNYQLASATPRKWRSGWIVTVYTIFYIVLNWSTCRSITDFAFWALGLLIHHEVDLSSSTSRRIRQGFITSFLLLLIKFKIKVWNFEQHSNNTNKLMIRNRNITKISSKRKMEQSVFTMFYGWAWLTCCRLFFSFQAEPWLTAAAVLCETFPWEIYIK